MLQLVSSRFLKTQYAVQIWKLIFCIILLHRQVPVSRKQVQFGLITYGERVYTEWELPLNSSRSNEQFIEKVDETPYIAEDCNLWFIIFLNKSHLLYLLFL